MLTMQGPGVRVRRPSFVPLLIALVVTIAGALYARHVLESHTHASRLTTKAGLVAMLCAGLAFFELIAR